jgi:peptidoglycan-N-acetylglucosamine deacetylase
MTVDRARGRALDPRDRRMLLAVLLLVACDAGPTLDEPPATRSDEVCSGIRVPDEGGFRNRVALTFDDGPDATSTPAIVAVLRRYRVPATFFFVGDRIGPTTVALAREIAAEPRFEIGAHGATHRDTSGLDRVEFRREADASFEAIRSVGAGARYFRFPFGRASCAALDVLRERGAIAVGWHVDSRDFERGPDEGPALVRQVLDELAQTRGGIVLLHADRAVTAASLELLVTTLLDAGYRFTSIGDREVFPKLNDGEAVHARMRRTDPPRR